MIENLFRGKRKYAPGWVVGNLVEFPSGRAKILVWNRADLEFDEIEVIPDTVGQYCCVVDRNKQMIFEGDILEFELYGVHFVGYVDFSGGRISVICDDGGPYLDDVILHHGAAKIGNIHDNPELIEI